MADVSLACTRSCNLRPATLRTVRMAGENSGHFRLAIGCSVSRLAGDRLAEGGLRRRKPRDRHPIGRARDVVEPDLVAERHRGGIAAVLAADADLEAGARPAAARHADLHEFTNTVAVDRDERIDLEDSLA